jgi:hypothetical protein
VRRLSRCWCYDEFAASAFLEGFSKVRARHDVVVWAVQPAFEHGQCRLRLGDPFGQCRLVASHHLVAVRCGAGRQYRSDVREAEAGLLRDQDRRHPVHVRVAVAAAGSVAGRGQQARRLPVPQYVRRQAEVVGHLAD